MEAKNGMLLWVLGGAGVLLMYSAYKNQNPQAILASHLTPTPPALPDAQIAQAYQGLGSHPSWDPSQGASYSVGQGAGGLNYLYDQHGNMTGVVPGPYQGQPNTYIPPRS